MRTARFPDHRFGTVIALASLSWPLMASAATEIRETKQAVVATDTAHVLEVLASSDVCHEGCRYFAPHVVREVRLKEHATADSYYKWTHVSQMKTVKFFKHFKIERGPVTQVHVRTLTRDQDAALIEELEAKTGLEHAPLFDVSTGTYTIVPKGSQVDVKITVMTRISGMMSLFAGAARKSMKESLDALFGNFTR